MQRITTLVWGLVLAFSVAAARPAWAEALNPAHVPQDAKWVIHVDFDAFDNTLLAKKIREKDSRVLKFARTWVENRYGINMQEDLHGLTMFGTSYRSHSGTVVLLSKFDQEKVKSQLEAKDNVTRTEWEGLTLYTLPIEKDGHWLGKARLKDSQPETDEPAKQDEVADELRDAKPGQDGHRTLTIALIDGNQAVFASTPEDAKTAVKLLKGQGTSLKGQESPLISKVPEGAVAYGAAIDLQKIEEHDGVFPILKQHEQAVYAIGNTGSEVFEDLKLVAASDKVAEDMKKALEGLVSFVRVWAADDPALVQLAADMQVTREGRTVTAQYRGDVDEVTNAFRAIVQRFQERQIAEKEGDAVKK